jgi:hypothetical protein
MSLAIRRGGAGDRPDRLGPGSAVTTVFSGFFDGLKAGTTVVSGNIEIFGRNPEI